MALIVVHTLTITVCIRHGVLLKSKFIVIGCHLFLSNFDIEILILDLIIDHEHLTYNTVYMPCVNVYQVNQDPFSTETTELAGEVPACKT